MEIHIEATCFNCETEFDESDDCLVCSVCENEFCENCQEEHAVKHCFEDNDAVKRPDEKILGKKQDITTGEEWVVDEKLKRKMK